jgi:hypothetical protein
MSTALYNRESCSLFGHYVCAVIKMQSYIKVPTSLITIDSAKPRTPLSLEINLNNLLIW